MDKQDLYPELKEYLEAIKANTSSRDFQKAVQGRAHFLAQAQAIKTREAKPGFSNLKKWINSIQQWDKRRLATALTSIIIAFILTFGAVGGTVYAAQDSVPYQALYPLKIFSENVRLSLIGNPEYKINLLTQFSRRRLDEINAIAEKGMEIPQETVSQLTHHTETLMQISEKLEVSTQTQSLSQILNAFLVHEAVINKLASREAGNATPALLRAQEKIQARIQFINSGVEDPASVDKSIKKEKNLGAVLNPSPVLADSNYSEGHQVEEEGKDHLCSSGPEERQHPIIAGIAETYEMDYQIIFDMFCTSDREKGDGHTGLGQIMLAFHAATLADESIEELLARRQGGEGWGQIWQDLGLIGKPKDPGPPEDKGKP